MSITAQMVKELRIKSSAGMMDCKKALSETNGDMDAAVDWLRKKGLATASKKSGRVASEGLIGICIEDNFGSIVEVNSETDFVATKSVSELTSTIEPKLSSIQIPIKPSEATRPDFLDAVASPFFLNQSTAASISPLVSDKAFLQSIIPALDLILNSLTICAVIDIFYSFGIKRGLFFWFRRFRL